MPLGALLRLRALAVDANVLPKQGWNVCRLHGDGGGAPRGKAHPNYKHGMRSLKMTETRELVRRLIGGLS